MIGMGLMGTVHSRALRDAVTRFGNGGSPVRLVVCADPAAGQTELARRLFGYERTTAEWREAVEADDVDVVMVCTPNATHLPIIEAAAAAGKHVFCEKPVGRSPAETIRIADICAEADVRSMVG